MPGKSYALHDSVCRDFASRDLLPRFLTSRSEYEPTASWILGSPSRRRGFWVFCAMEKFRVYSELSFQCSRHFTALRLLPSPASSRSSRHRLRNCRHHPHHRRHHHFLQVFRLSRDQAAGQLLVKQTFGVGLTSLLTTKHLEGFPSTCWHIDPRPETARQHSACRVSISRNRGLSKQSLNACT